MLAAWGCSDNRTDTKDLLVRVGNHTLSQRQLEADMPAGLSPEDRAAFTKQYIDDWVSSVLLYDVALKNLPDVERLDRLVDDYRRDLFVYEYCSRLADERVETDIPEDSIRLFYEENSSHFTLHKAIVKGMLLKVPKNAPSLSSLRTWVASGAQSAVEKIEKYAIKNAIGYDYFYDHWVWFDDVKDNIPYDFGNDDSFLRQHKNLEVTQNDNIYLLHISEHLTAQSVMPYEFARQRIIEILTNRKRVKFNEELKHEVYDDAVREGRIEYFYGDTLSVTENVKK